MQKHIPIKRAMPRDRRNICSERSCPELWAPKSSLLWLCGCLDSVQYTCNEELRNTGQRTGSCLMPKEVICLPKWFQSQLFYQFNAQAAFIISLPWGSASLQRTSVGCVSVKVGGRGLVLDPQGHSAFRVIHCLGPLFVQFLQRAKGPTKGEERCRAGVLLGARDLHLPSTHYHLQSFWS